MPARTKRIRQDENTRKKIQAAQLINRLTSHVMSEDGDVMTTSQVNAALGLLKKILPDLKATEHSGEIGVYETIAERLQRARDRQKK